MSNMLWELPGAVLPCYGLTWLSQIFSGIFVRRKIMVGSGHWSWLPFGITWSRWVMWHQLGSGHDHDDRWNVQVCITQFNVCLFDRGVTLSRWWVMWYQKSPVANPPPPRWRWMDPTEKFGQSCYSNFLWLCSISFPHAMNPESKTSTPKKMICIQSLLWQKYHILKKKPSQPTDHKLNTCTLILLDTIEFDQHFWRSRFAVLLKCV